mgnify:CR=1 FL=1
MRSAAEECWILSENCSRWAEESRDDATRLAFRQMAKTLAELAFIHHFTPTDERIDTARSENSETTPAEHAPPSPSFVMPLTENENDGLESDVDTEVDAEKRDRKQRLSLPSPTLFPKR